MRLIIAGSRFNSLSPADISLLDDIHSKHGVTEVVSGGASGIDHAGEAWAASRDIPCTVFPADWRNHGRAAGPIRNAAMAAYADAVALFPGGRGTLNMRLQAQKKGLRIFDFMLAPASI